jgi:hypothetical protein
MSSKYQNNGNFDRINYKLGIGFSLTVPEILILGALGIVIILAIFLCFLEFRRCAQNIFDGRRRKKRVLKYLTVDGIMPTQAIKIKNETTVETPEKNMMKNI